MWRWVWLAVPLAGVLELGAHLYFEGSAPRDEQWAELAPKVGELRKSGDLLVTAPAWAEPLARQAFDAAWMPLSDVARPDVRSHRRAIEVGLLGERSPELQTWRVLEERKAGEFLLRVLANPTPFVPETRFVDLVEAGRAEVFVDDGREAPCPWNPRATRKTGGLHGHAAFPARRFECQRNSPYFVGVTVIEDEHYRPRRCIWAHPPAKGELVVRFVDVALGPVLRGYAGLSYFLFRDGVGTNVVLEAKVGGRSLGSYKHQDAWGWRSFEMPTAVEGNTANIEFRVSSARAANRHFCFYAETGQ